MLPSFLYLPHPDELRPEDRVLPWGEPPFVVGELARAMGSRTPIRLVQRQSWLCHPGWIGVPPSCRWKRRRKWDRFRRCKPRSAIWNTCAPLGTISIPMRH